MSDFKDFIKDALGYIVMMTIVFSVISYFGVQNWNSYIIGLCIGFGMPMFTIFWTRFTDRW